MIALAPFPVSPGDAVFVYLVLFDEMFLQVYFRDRVGVAGTKVDQRRWPIR